MGKVNSFLTILFDSILAIEEIMSTPNLKNLKNLTWTSFKSRNSTLKMKFASLKL